jgi:hypothetical protein
LALKPAPPILLAGLVISVLIFSILNTSVM